MIHSLAPSDLSYLYDRCPRCYWLKLRRIIGPSDQLPAAFRDIDKAQKEGITIETLRELGIPAAEFIKGDKVKSRVEEFGGAQLFISGYTDRRVRLDDGTVGVIDFKTSAPRLDKLGRFWRSMSAYQYAIENAEKDAEEVTQLGLVVFSPNGFSLRKDNATQAFYRGGLMHVPIEIDRPKFQQLLETVGKIVDFEDMPPPSACDTCKHVQVVADRQLDQVLRHAAAAEDIGQEMAEKFRQLFNASRETLR